MTYICSHFTFSSKWLQWLMAGWALGLHCDVNLISVAVHTDNEQFTPTFTRSRKWLLCTLQVRQHLFLSKKGSGSVVAGDKNSTRSLVIMGQKLLSSLRVRSRKDEWFFPKHSSYKTSAFGRITQGSHIIYSLLHTLLKDKCMGL